MKARVVTVSELEIRKQVEKEFDRLKSDVYDSVVKDAVPQFTAVCLCVLHREYGFGAKRMKGYCVEAARIKDGPYTDSDHYGFILGRNAHGHYVTWHFHLLDDNSVSVYWGHYFMENRDAAVQDFNTRGKENISQ